MRNTYIIFVIALLLGSCYDDKGNYEYNDLLDVSISVPFEEYDAGIGSKLTIIPSVETQIKETDLNYQWEIGDFSEEIDGYYTFIKFAEGKELDYTLDLFEHMKSPGNYYIRLHVIDEATGRSFYSSIITLRLTSDYTGLVVLHGNDTECDIALLKATDFLNTQGETTTIITPSLYSSINHEKIPGKGKSIIQSITYYLSYVERATVVAMTENDGVWINYDDFSKGGDWNSMFNSGVNKGEPQYYQPQGQVIYAVDGGQIFPRRNNSYTIFPIPGMGLDDYYASSPFFEVSGNVQGFFFDQNSKGFVVTTNSYAFGSLSTSSSFSQITTNTEFNLAAMNADLLYVDKGGQSGHFMAVMREDSGNKYLAEINWAASTDNEIPVARYDMGVLPDINNSKYYAFGDNQAAMCYYATPSTVYRLTALPGYDLSGRYNPLQLEDGTPISFDGEITMMKILKPLKNTSGSLKVDYYNYNKIMLVGVYKNGEGVLYSLKLNEATGDVISFKTFSGFDRIYDANIKGL